MTIREKIRHYVSAEADKHVIQDIRIGLGYTAVMLDSGKIGLAYTPHRAMPNGCSLFSDFMPKKNFPAKELLNLITSENVIETAIGLAVANALISKSINNYTTGDVLEITQLDTTDCVGMVGHFAPLVPSIREKVSKLMIFEQIDHPRGNLIPTAEIENQLPECTVALITATSIINHSFDRIIKAVGNCREVIVLGASTPLLPDLFSGTPVTCLSGVIVTDEQEILKIVSFGGGMRMFKHCIKKINQKI